MVRDEFRGFRGGDKPTRGTIRCNSGKDIHTGRYLYTGE